jgi:CBS domain-containing protein
MKIESVMSKDIGTCTPAQSLNDAAQIMWERDCGIVPIVGHDGDRRLLGVITDRDIAIAAYTKGRRLSEIGIGDVMTKAVISCRSTDSVDDAERAMRQAQVHRLPVVDEAGAVVGVLSLADIACATHKGIEKVSPRDLGETVAAIRRPRAQEMSRSA